MNNLPRKIPKLRESARDAGCVMCGDPNAVLAHRNLPGEFGVGLKGPDFWGAHLCLKHHQYGDGEGRKDYQFWELAVYRTQKRWWSEGLVRVS